MFSPVAIARVCFSVCGTKEPRGKIPSGTTFDPARTGSSWKLAERRQTRGIPWTGRERKASSAWTSPSKETKASHFSESGAFPAVADGDFRENCRAYLHKSDRFAAISGNKEFSSRPCGKRSMCHGQITQSFSSLSFFRRAKRTEKLHNYRRGSFREDENLSREATSIVFSIRPFIRGDFILLE